MTTNRFPFPEPRYPDYLKTPNSIDDLLPPARKAVERTTGRGALGLAKPGDKVLIVTPCSLIQDRLVVEAVLQAYKEKGISADAVTEQEIGMGLPPEQLEKMSAEDGWKEIFWREQNTEMLPPEIQVQKPKSLVRQKGRKPLKDYLQKHREYTAVFCGQGGRDHWKHALDEERDRFKTNWIYLNSDDLLSRWSDFPSDVWHLVEKKTTELIPQAEEVRITDPQGTEVWWSVTEEEAREWGRIALLTGHLFMFPMATRGTLCELDHLRGKQKEIFHFPKVQGVLAGTGNHFGYYPHMRGYLEDGIIVRLEGGGLFGEMIRIILARTRNVQYPIYPKPGYLYLVGACLGTNPKYFRNRLALFETYRWSSNNGERNRSGVIHFDMGLHSTNPEIVKFAKEHNLPTQHGWHFHTYFNTYRVKFRKTGEWKTIIDKGRITALDDPEVRNLASRYGNPDELLREDWVPAIPGINYPGDYMRDYGNDPSSWIRKELEGRFPLTIGVPI